MAFTKERSGRWHVYWRDEDGRQRAKSFGTDRKTAEAEVKRLNARRELGVPEPSGIAFEELWAEWWSRRVERKLTPKVQRSYQGYGRRLVLPFWRGRRVASIRHRDVAEWIEWAEATGASPWSVREAFVCLRSCLAYAEKHHDVPNACRGMAEDLPDVPPRRERPHLSPQQVLALADAVGPHYRLLVLAMGVLGLRPGEAIGLRTTDVDLEAGVLNVRRSVVNAAGTMVENPTTKTKRERCVPVGFLRGEFERQLRRPAPRATWRGEPVEGVPDLLCPPVQGRGWIHTDLLRQVVRRGGQRIGVKGLAPSDLRHAAATNARDAAGDLLAAQDLLGHSDPRMTNDHYLRATAARLAALEGALAEAYGRA